METRNGDGGGRGTASQAKALHDGGRKEEMEIEIIVIGAGSLNPARMEWKERKASSEGKTCRAVGRQRRRRRGQRRWGREGKEEKKTQRDGDQRRVQLVQEAEREGATTMTGVRQLAQSRRRKLFVVGRLRWEGKKSPATNHAVVTKGITEWGP